MSLKHIFLVLLVVVIWGCNFIFIKFGVAELPPLFLCTLRFFLASIPAIFFIKFPAAPIKWVISYGLLMFALQFSLLFMGIKAGITPGLASLVVQIQVFFSIFFAAILLNEIPAMWQIIGAVLAFFGIGVVAMHLDGASATLPGLLLVMGASVAYGLGNLVTKKLGRINMMSLVVWGSFIACIPLLLCSLYFDGWQQIYSSVHHVSWLGICSLLYIVYLSTWVGYGIWNKLISSYPIATVVPFTLLVPIVGMLSSILILGEPLQPWKIIAGLLVIAGLCVNLGGAYVKTRLTAMRMAR